MSAANERERRPKTENARSGRGSRDLRRVKGALFDVVEHYAGRPVAVKSDDKCKSRIHKCPMCRNNSYKARVYNDARPQGSGFVGCTTKGCSVPSKTDALGTVAHFQQLSGSRPIPEAMRHIDEILTPKKTPPDWRQSFTPTQQQTPTADDNANAPQSDDPQLETAPPETAPHNISNSPSDSPALPPSDPHEGLHPVEPDPVAAHPEPVGHAPQHGEDDHRDETPAEADPAEDDESDAAGSQADDSDLNTRDAVYRTILRATAPDSVLVAFMASIGVSHSVVRTASIGISYASDAGEILEDLALTHGAATLARVPGFRSRGTKLETELSCADLALIPYTDQKGRVVALEAITIASPSGDSTDPLHRLLGGGPRNHDDKMGGARHMWLPGHPAALEGVTDDILEALRATSCGAMVGAIHGIEVDAAASARAALGDTNTDADTESNGLFRGRTLLWIPGPSHRAREAAMQNAQAVLADRGAKVRILSRPPTGEDFQGIGTYLASKPEPDQRAAYINLFADAYSTALPQPEREARSQTGFKTGEEAPDDVAQEEAPPDPYESFKRAGRRRRPQPRFKAFSAPEILLAVTVFTAALLMVHSLSTYVLEPLASALDTTLAPALAPAQPADTPVDTSGLGIPGEAGEAAAGEAAAGEAAAGEAAAGEAAPEADKHWLMNPDKPTLAEPGTLLPWLLGFVLRAVAGLLGEAVAWVGEPRIGTWSVPPLAGTIGVTVGGVAGLVSASRLRKLRIERYRMEDGRIGDMTVHHMFLKLTKEEKRSLPWLPPTKKRRPKKRAVKRSNGRSNGRSSGRSGKPAGKPDTKLESIKRTPKERKES